MNTDTPSSGIDSLSIIKGPALADEPGSAR